MKIESGVYTKQGNGKGKSHLIGEESVLCGSFGMFNHTAWEDVIIKDGEFLEIAQIGRSYENQYTANKIYEPGYCKKCLKKAMKIYNESLNQ